jgi:hypothetical protein
MTMHLPNASRLAKRCDGSLLRRPLKSGRAYRQRDCPRSCHGAHFARITKWQQFVPIEHKVTRHPCARAGYLTLRSLVTNQKECGYADYIAK